MFGWILLIAIIIFAIWSVVVELSKKTVIWSIIGIITTGIATNYVYDLIKDDLPYIDKDDSVNETNGSVDLAEDEYQKDTTQDILAESSSETLLYNEYIFEKGAYSWSKANDICKQKGGHLVWFDTKGELQYVISQFTNKGFDKNTMFWIGAARDSANNAYEYYWINVDGSFKDGHPINQDSYWLKNEPSYIDPKLGNAIEDRVMLLYYDEKWVYNDEPDSVLQYSPNYSDNLGFICEIEKDK